MNADNLSKRLTRVTSYIKKGSILADIGSDHAYLPCYAVKEEIVQKAIAGEVVEGPYQSALSQVSESNLEDYISVRKGDGLEVLSPGEATAITICGMGGSLISNILESGKTKLSGRETLILQPNIGAQFIRRWLITEGWELKAEEILEEDGKIYEILVAEKGEPLKAYHELPFEAAELMGPFLLKEKNPIFMKKWTMELKHWYKILKQIESSDNERTQEKKSEIQKSINLVEEALQ